MHIRRLGDVVNAPGTGEVVCRWVILLLALLLAAGSGWAQLSDPPRLLAARVDCFFSPARPGDQVTVTVRAQREGGLQELHGFFERSQYLRADGKNEPIMSSAWCCGPRIGRTSFGLNLPSPPAT